MVPAPIQDVCFMAAFELTRAIAALDAARDVEALAIANETALRKVERVLAALGQAGAVGSDRAAGELGLDRRPDGSELQSGLCVRKLYARFRQSLRRPEDGSRDAVLTALRYAAGALAALAASPHYGLLRVSDRTLLRRQRDRLLDWAHAGKPTEAGVRLLEDIFTWADLLRDINRRQELRGHDRELICTLVSDVRRGRADWLDELDRLAGLDDQLDALTARLRRAANLDAVTDIVIRLSWLIGA